MDVTLLLADAARAHGDGTVSMLRSGIDRLFSEQVEAIGFKAALVVRIRGEAADAGAHVSEVRLVGDDDETVFETPAHEFQIPEHGGAHMLVADLVMQFPRLGGYRFEVRVDGELLATWPIAVAGPTQTRDQVAVR